MISAAQAPTLRSSSRRLFLSDTAHKRTLSHIVWKNGAVASHAKANRPAGEVRPKLTSLVVIAMGQDKRQSLFDFDSSPIPAHSTPRSSDVEHDRGMLAPLLDLTLQARFELALRHAMTQSWSLLSPWPSFWRRSRLRAGLFAPL
jgi:hypothetical protein